MTVKRFVAANARECLRRVKDELGPDAVVVSNKAVEGGIEMWAASPDSLDEMARQTAPRATAAPPATPALPVSPAGDDYKVTLSQNARKPAPEIRPWAPPGMPVKAAAPEDPSRLRPLPPRPAREAAVPSAAQVAASLRQAAEEAAPSDPAGNPQVTQMMDDMRTIRSLLERQLAGFAWGELARDEPLRALLLAELLDVGFSGQLARRMIQEMPGNLDQDGGRRWLKSAVNRRLRTLPTEADFIDRGGVYALVGPTGVGKTTTTAKLAARCVVRYGADRLALLTTDSYRIGAQEQLRIYGRILGVPVFVVRDAEDLRRTLVDLRDKHMILIDTVGMSQRDRMVAEQAAMLAQGGEVNRLLLLNAGARGDTLDDVVRCYSGEDLAGCILTKVDEAPSLAPALDCVLRHGLTLSYVCNGQRVPEDLHLPNRSYLLHRAFKVGAGDTAHRLRDEEIALAMASREVRAGSTIA